MMYITQDFFNEKIRSYNDNIIDLYEAKMKSLNRSCEISFDRYLSSKIFHHGKCLYHDSMMKVSFYIGEIPTKGQFTVTIQLSQFNPNSTAKTELRNFVISDQSMWVSMNHYLLKLIKSTMNISLDIHSMSLLKMKNHEVNPISLKTEYRDSTISYIVS